MNELEQLHLDVAAWEKQLDGFREEASRLEKEAERKWNDVIEMEGRLSRDLNRIAQLEA